MSDIPTGLVFADAPPAPSTANFLIFGPVGSGKSTAAATLSKRGPILWLNLEGGGALAYARKTAADTILEVRINVAEVRKPGEKSGTDPHQILREFVKHARDGDPRPATVVIDTIGKLRDALAAQYVVPASRQSRDQWGEVAKILRGAIAVLRDLPLNLVLIGHQDISEDDDERIIRPKIGGALTEDVPAEMDVVAYTHPQVVQDDDSDPATRRKVYYGQLVDGRGRQGLKDRSGGLGLWRELDLDEWLTTYCAALTADNADLPFDPGEVPEGDEPADAPDDEAQQTLGEAA